MARARTHPITAEERVKKYLSTFENVTPNDRMLIGQMAEIEHQLEMIAQKRRDNPDMPLSEFRQLSEMETKYSTEHRQIQSSLGINRASRETEIDTANEIQRFRDGAKKLLAEHGIPIRCPHCKTINLNQGFIVFHFRQDVPWEWKSECPKCHNTFLINSKNVEVSS